MAVTFVTTDLLTDISQKELDGLSLKLKNIGDPDFVATAISRAQGQIDLYCGRRALPTDLEKRLIAAIAIYEIVCRIGQPEKKRIDSYQEAMKTLRDIRDGKFADLIDRSPIPSIIQPIVGGYGSETQINTSRTAPASPGLA